MTPWIEGNNRMVLNTKLMSVILVLPWLIGCTSRTKGDPLSESERDAMAKLDAEADSEAIPEPVIPKQMTPNQNMPKVLLKAPTVRADDTKESGSEARCYEFKFLNQRGELLNRDSASVCAGDSDKQVFLHSRQGRSVILTISADAVIDPVAGITFMSERKLLCYDHNLPPNARKPWFQGQVVVNCCSDVSFVRTESGNEAAAVSGRLEGPPPNCGQD